MIDPLAPDTNRMAPDRAPTPFSAAAIAAACLPHRLPVLVCRNSAGAGPAYSLRTRLPINERTFSSDGGGPVRTCLPSMDTSSATPHSATASWVEVSISR